MRRNYVHTSSQFKRARNSSGTREELYVFGRVLGTTQLAKISQMARSIFSTRTFKSNIEDGTEGPKQPWRMVNSHFESDLVGYASFNPRDPAAGFQRDNTRNKKSSFRTSRGPFFIPLLGLWD